MNDYWNDPPESVEPPACPQCKSWDTDVEDWPNCKCGECGHAWKLPEEPDHAPEPDCRYKASRGCGECGKEVPEQWEYSLCKACGENPCRHGNPRHNCDACDFESDIAFDASR